MLPTLLARTVLGKAGRIGDAQLTSDICDHAGRRLCGVLQKGAQIAPRAQLQREAKTVMIAPAQDDELTVGIIAMKVMRQLIGGEFADIVSIAPLLLVG